MSETVYSTGKITKINPSEYENIFRKEGYPMRAYHNDYLDCIVDEGYRKYVNVDGVLYEKSNVKELDDDEDIFEAVENEDGSINYTIKYYNGGCGESEAIGYALENLTINQGKLRILPKTLTDCIAVIVDLANENEELKEERMRNLQ